MKHTLLLLIVSALGLSAFALASPQESIPLVPVGSMPTFSAGVTSRTVTAVNYQHRSGTSKIDFAGTDLMPSARGEADVKSKKGYMQVEVEFASLQEPTTFGNEYLTYILWAISPEGRPVNLGEVIVGKNHRSKLDVTTDLQAFALIVTAEPYYAVRQPSNVVVLENVVRADTRGTTEAVNAKYELMERGGYIPTGYKFDPVVLDAKLPLEFLEARNALRIAQSEGAETYAAESYQHAVQLMNTADGLATNGHSDKNRLIAASRQTVQTAEDAREIAVKKSDEVRRATEQQASANAQARSQARADDATRMKEKAQSEAAMSQANAATAQANEATAHADAASAQSALIKSENASAAAISVAQTDAQRAWTAMVTSQNASTAAVNAAQADADQSRSIAQQAEQREHDANTQKADLRAQLSAQLNKVLETRDSARGLIVSMSDVLFDTGAYSLKPGAREKLSKVSGILIAYPTLSVQVGGYTDNVGGDEMNQKLSENRATSVRDYMVEQGVAANSVTARGFGNTLPVASNENSTGRQQNRRVELVVSGDVIGSPVNATTGSLR